MSKWLVMLGLALALATAGHAQLKRNLPANAKLGEIAGRQQPFPLVLIDSKVMRLSAGALIYDENNRTILHQAIPERAYILYVVQEPSGEVTRVYILRPDELEAARLRLPAAPALDPLAPVPAGTPVPTTPTPAPTGPTPLPAR